MKRDGPGRYKIQVGDDIYHVLKETHEVPSIRKRGQTVIVTTWTPLLNGDAKPFDCMSYPTYMDARSAVHNHIDMVKGKSGEESS